MKSEKADLVVSAVERFAQVIPLNIQEIFLWYFEQKGVENPERFLGVNNEGVNENIVQNQSADMFQQLTNQNPENQLSQYLPQDSPQQEMSAILNLLKLVYKYASENGEKSSELEKLIDSLETMTEAE